MSGSARRFPATAGCSLRGRRSGRSRWAAFGCGPERLLSRRTHARLSSAPVEKAGNRRHGLPRDRRPHIVADTPHVLWRSCRAQRRRRSRGDCRVASFSKADCARSRATDSTYLTYPPHPTQPDLKGTRYRSRPMPRVGRPGSRIAGSETRRRARCLPHRAGRTSSIRPRADSPRAPTARRSS